MNSRFKKIITVSMICASMAVVLIPLTFGEHTTTLKELAYTGPQYDTDTGRPHAGDYEKIPDGYLIYSGPSAGRIVDAAYDVSKLHEVHQVGEGAWVETYLPNGKHILEATSTESYKDLGKARARPLLKEVTQTSLSLLEAKADISLDATATTSISSGSSVTFSHTVGSGSNTILTVKVQTRGGSRVTTGIKYAGTDMVNPAVQDQSTNTSNASIWTLANPATGANNVAVTYEGGVLASMVIAQSFFGVDTTPKMNVEATSTNKGGSNTSSTVSVTTVTANAWTTDSMSQGGTVVTLTPGAGQVNVRREDGRGGSTQGPTSPAGSVTFTWSWTNNRNWAAAVVALKPFVPPGSPFPAVILKTKTIIMGHVIIK